MALCCNHCNKIFKTITNLKKHIFICEHLKKNKTHNNNNNNNNETEELPSHKQLYEMFICLANKHNKLETEFNEYKKFNTINTNCKIKYNDIKNNFNIIEILNSNNTYNSEEITFDNFYNKLPINNENIFKIMIDNTFTSCLNEIFLKYIESSTTNNINIPIIAFTQKPNYIYILIKNTNDNDNNNNNTWCELTNNKLIYLLNIIHHLLIGHINKWKTDFILNNATNAEHYQLILKKMLHVNFKSVATINKIKQQLYANFKTDLMLFIK
jgi:hypothetical protein